MKKPSAPLTLRERAHRYGHWSAARWAFNRDIPFTMCYIEIFGRLPRL